MQSSGHILIVDDIDGNRDILSCLLLNQYYSVTLANAGSQALEKLVAEHFDLVLLDIRMPGMNGLEVLEEIRKQYSMTDLPVIMVTSIDQCDDVTKALSLGANDYVTKITDKRVLLARVRTQLSLARAHNKLSGLAREISRKNKFLLKLFGRYVADEVVENLLESPTGTRIGGDLHKVTILFADIRDFTRISMDMSPDRVVSMLNNFFDVMIDIVRKHNGTVDKLIGDGILVTFGVPHSRPDDAKRALACALEMQYAMPDVNKRNEEDELPLIKQGIGINTGEVSVGDIGSEKRANYSVIGKHVNLAARISSYAAGDEILISESSLQDGGRSVCVDGKREIQPKGVDHPLLVYSLCGFEGCNHSLLKEFGSLSLSK